jgi:sporulation protein YlmC with PRC-barrel domain
MQSTTTTTPLVSLKSEKIELADSSEDIRGLKIVDRDGQEVGKVDDVFVDPNERRARFLVVKSGDILGLGGKKFLIPVDAIQSHDADQVVINETRDRILGGPQVDGEFRGTSDELAETGETRTTGGEMSGTGGTRPTDDTAGTLGVGEDAPPALVIAVYEWYDIDQPYWSPDYQRRSWA